MKLTCVIPTRGRPHLLVGCVQSFARMRSGKHEAEIVLAVDVDDNPTLAMAFDLRATFPMLSVRGYDRLQALGSYYNDVCRNHPADAYCAIGDDTLCTGVDWDDAIANAVTTDPKGLWWWTCDGPRQCIYPVMSHGWYAAAGRFFTDLFPFWFDDVWLREVAVMVFGREIDRIPCARLVDTVTRTTRMYDLRFWDDFYQATRPARVAEARRIAEALGLPNIAHAVRPQLGPNRKFREESEKTVELQGDVEPPSPGYLAAKKHAETVMARIAMLKISTAAA